MNGKQGLRKGAIWTGSHLLELSYILSLLVFPAACIVETFLRTGRPGELQMVLAFFTGLLMIHPLILTVINVFYWICPGRCPAVLDAGNRTEIFVIVEGIAFSFLLLGIVGENWSDWWTPLDSGRSFSPVCSKALPTLAVLTLAAIIGYAVLRLTPADRLSAPVGIVCLGAVYLGCALCLLWLIQLAGGTQTMKLYLMLFPFNSLLLVGKMVKKLLRRRPAEQQATAEAPDAQAAKKQPLRLPDDPVRWLWLAIPAAMLLLGFVILLLIPLGQAPDSIVTAWTDTADWSLSLRTAQAVRR